LLPAKSTNFPVYQAGMPGNVLPGYLLSASIGFSGLMALVTSAKKFFTSPQSAFYRTE